MNKTEKHIIREVYSVERKNDSKGNPVQLEKHEVIERKHYRKTDEEVCPAIEAPHQSSSRLCKK